MSSFDFFAELRAIYRRDDFSPTEKHLTVVVLSFRNKKDGTCTPPIDSKTPKKTGELIESIVSRARLSDRAVQKNLEALESRGGVLTRIKHKHASVEFTFCLNACFHRR